MRIPGIHSIHWKVFIFHMVILIVPMTYMAFRVRDSIETSYLHATEEGMIDTAAVVAELYRRTVETRGDDPEMLREEFSHFFSEIARTQPAGTQLFGFTRGDVGPRLLLYDAKGHVVYDSRGNSDPGTDFSEREDVRTALAGEYGSRWELPYEGPSVDLYSTLPVNVDGRVVGAVTVSKPTGQLYRFIRRSLLHLLIPGTVALCVATAMAYAMSAYITRTLWSIARKAERVAAGEPNVRVETWTRSELGMMARAFEKMRRKLEGKEYVEEMVANLSHELKTPLSAIRGSAEILEDVAIDDTETRGRFLRNIQSEVGRLDRIVSNLLALARIEVHPGRDTPEPVDAAAVLREVGAVYSVRAEHAGVQFATDVPEESIPVRLGVGDLENLVATLLDNALRFTCEGGAVTLSLGRTETHVTMRVKDNGVGIDPELLPKVFDRFFTTESPRTGNRGTGLGLAIARSIAISGRGEIEVKSEPGLGTEFTVTLPRA